MVTHTVETYTLQVQTFPGKAGVRRRPLEVWRKERRRMCELVTDCGYPTLRHHALGPQTKTDTTLEPGTELS